MTLLYVKNYSVPILAAPLRFVAYAVCSKPPAKIRANIFAQKLQFIGHISVVPSLASQIRFVASVDEALYFQKLESLAYIFAADSMDLASFKFVQWAPKDASFRQQSAYRPFKVIKGR